MRRALLATLLSASIALPAATADAQIPLDRETDQGIGAMAGLASGAGLAYQEILPSSLGFRGALALWKTGDFSFFDAGVTGLKVLSDDGVRRLYLLAAVSYWRRSDEETIDVLEDGMVVGEREVDDVDDSGSIGVGVGIELPLGARTAVALEGVFTYWTDNGDLLPLPQIGLFYRF